jgi:hypothetical protein
MPYIKVEKREPIDKALNHLLAVLKNDPDNVHGNLNYAFTKLLIKTLGDDINYKKLQDHIGVLECCKLEMYRILVSEYEDKKCQDNGEVFPELSDFNKNEAPRKKP